MNPNLSDQFQPRGPRFDVEHYGGRSRVYLVDDEGHNTTTGEVFTPAMTGQAAAYHRSPVTNFAYRPDFKGSVRARDILDGAEDNLHGWENTSQLAELRASDEPGAQGRLFGHSHRPGYSTVDYLATTRERRAMAIPLLGALQNETWKRHGLGRNLGASGNLSRHSAPLVDKLVERGAVADPSRTETNSLGFQPPGPWVNDTDGIGNIHTMSPGERKAAKRTGRSAIRPPKAKPAPPTEQGKLF